LRAETEIAISVEPQCEWVPISDKKPLANVKLGAVN